MKIIVVDDDRIIRMGLCKVIKRLFDNHEVVGDFSNGLTALEYLKEKKSDIDLVITDIKMPVMSGVDLIRKSQELLQKPPMFIVLSGYDEFNYVRDTMKSGAFNYLLKPIKSEELECIIQEVESKMKSNQKMDKMFNKSVEMLKREFFKNILFSNKDIDCIKNSLLLDNIQFEEDYIFKMIVTDKDEDDSQLLKSFISTVLKLDSNIEYSFFYYKELTYIIFYFKYNQCNEFELIVDRIENETDMFVFDNKKVYILKHTDKVWELRDESNLIRRISGNFQSNKAKKYFIYKTDRLPELINEENANASSSAINIAIKYITNNFKKSITLKDVAEEVFLSQNYFSELFKKETGEGFYDFLSNYRINKAKEILITTNLKIYEVAQMVGYNDSITFGRAFKKLTGVTPNNYRGRD